MITDPEFAPFSHAMLDPAGRAALRTKLIVSAAQLETAAFLRRHGKEVARTSSSLTEFLSGWCQGDATIEEAMLLPLAIRSVRNGDLDPVWIAALSAAHLHAIGREGEWHATFAQHAPVRFGCRQTPPIRDIAVTAWKDRVEVSLDGCAPITVGTIESDIPMAPFTRVCVPILGPNTQRVLPMDNSVAFTHASFHEVERQLAEAHAILARGSPEYLKWVEDSLSAVVPVESPAENALQSFSLTGFNGVVFVSFPSPPVKIAEMLVHECSHQYFHFGLLDTLFSNGMDKSLYWSPYVAKDRPIDRILIAFHAFANIVLFYRACLAAGVSELSETAEREIAFNLQHLGAMSDYLQRSRGLSPTGRGLFEPLRDELFRC